MTDVTISPSDLAHAPLFADLLGGMGFTPREHPGRASALMASTSISGLLKPSPGPGGRGAPAGTTRQARCPPSQGPRRLPRQPRETTHRGRRLDEPGVAGPGALLVAKVDKIAERVARRPAFGTRSPSTCSGFSARWRGKAWDAVPPLSPVGRRRRRDAPSGGPTAARSSEDPLPRASPRRCAPPRGRGCSRNCCGIWGTSYSRREPQSDVKLAECSKSRDVSKRTSRRT